MSNNSKFDYTKEEISIYSTYEYLVRDYDIFYEIENICKQIISALSEENYKGVYKIFSSDIAGDISKEQYVSVLSEFYISNFADTKDENGNVLKKYENNKNLVNVYRMSDVVYIAEIKNNHETTTRIGIRLKSNFEYEIVYFEV